MTVDELLRQIQNLYDNGEIDSTTPVQVLVSEEYLQRPVERLEVQGVSVSTSTLILRTPEAS